MRRSGVDARAVGPVSSRRPKRASGVGCPSLSQQNITPILPELPAVGELAAGRCQLRPPRAKLGTARSHNRVFVMVWHEIPLHTNQCDYLKFSSPVYEKKYIWGSISSGSHIVVMFTDYSFCGVPERQSQTDLLSNFRSGHIDWLSSYLQSPCACH